MSHNTALEVLNCSDNRFTTEALNNLFDTLHDNENVELDGKTVDVSKNPGVNDLTSRCDPEIAERKGWRVFMGYWKY